MTSQNNIYRERKIKQIYPSKFYGESSKIRQILCISYVWFPTYFCLTLLTLSPEIVWALTEGPPMAGHLQELPSTQILSCLKMWAPIPTLPRAGTHKATPKIVRKLLALNFLLSIKSKACQIHNVWQREGIDTHSNSMMMLRKKLLFAVLQL